MIGIGTGLTLLIVAPLIKETSELIIHLPNTLDKLIPNTGLLEHENLREQSEIVSQKIFSFSLSIISNLLAFLFLLVMTFYFLIEKGRLDRLIAKYFAGKDQRVVKTVREIENKLGFWARGQVLLCLNIGVLTYIALLLLGIPYALPLAILSGVMEAVPILGSLISTIPAVLIALTISPTQALLTGLAFFAIQQVQNNFVIPQVMKVAIGLNPFVVLLAITTGGELLGITGALLAIPITATLQLIIREALREKSSPKTSF